MPRGALGQFKDEIGMASPNSLPGPWAKTYGRSKQVRMPELRQHYSFWALTSPECTLSFSAIRVTCESHASFKSITFKL